MVCSVVLAAALPLFEGGKTAWTIETDGNAAPPVKYAAEELANALGRVSGATFAVTNGVAGPKIVIGVMPDDGRAGARPSSDDVVELKWEGDVFRILGDKPRSALYATYWFLQKELGVRWLWPGEDGAFYPKRDSYALPEGLNLRYQPQFQIRGLHLCGSKRLEEFAFKEWMARNMMNWQTRGVNPGEEKFGFPNCMGGHNLNLNKHDKLFAEHPEYFAEVKGERTMKNICLCRDEIVPIIAGDLCRRIAKQPNKLDYLGVSLNDNGAYCQCTNCAAIDL